VETELWDWYQAQAPGRVLVVGPDVMNGSPAQLQNFKNVCGISFPMLLKAAMEPGSNMLLTYGGRHNYIVIDQDGIIRFNAQQQGYPYGTPLDVPRIRQIVDSLLAVAVSVPGAGAGTPQLTAGPSPFRDRLRVSFAHPGLDGAALRVEVFDLAGRRVARLLEGTVRGAETRLTWDGRDDVGAPVPAGLYLVRARAGELALVRRVARLR
jgi:hypothetical protein